MEKAQKARKEKYLNRMKSFDELETDTLKALMIEAHAQGWTVKSDDVPAVRFDRRVYNRFTDYAQQEAYERRCETTKTEYQLWHPSGYYYLISKIEFNYFNYLNW